MRRFGYKRKPHLSRKCCMLMPPSRPTTRTSTVLCFRVGFGTPTQLLDLSSSSLAGTASRIVKLGSDAAGTATAKFDAAAITDGTKPLLLPLHRRLRPPRCRSRCAHLRQMARQVRATAAWLAGQPIAMQNGCTLRIRNGVQWIWGKDDKTSRVLRAPPQNERLQDRRLLDSTQPIRNPCQNAENIRSLKLTVYLMDYDNVKYPARGTGIDD